MIDARRVTPFSRYHRGIGGALVILARGKDRPKATGKALCLLPDGRLEWRSLSGVSAAVPRDVGEDELALTTAQQAVLRALEPVWP